MDAPNHPDPLAVYRIATEPYYRSVGNELALFDTAFALRMPLMLKGPTGCGKSRFVEHMWWRLGKPLITVACNEDITAGDLVGRWLLDAEGTRWQDGPLAQAARFGAICYLDEVVEGRADTTVVIHPLTDARRILTIDKLNELVHAHPDFHLVVSYNPGYQNVMKDLKTSTLQCAARSIAVHTARRARRCTSAWIAANAMSRRWCCSTARPRRQTNAREATASRPAAPCSTWRAKPRC